VYTHTHVPPVCTRIKLLNFTLYSCTICISAYIIIHNIIYVCVCLCTYMVLNVHFFFLRCSFFAVCFFYTYFQLINRTTDGNLSADWQAAIMQMQSLGRRFGCVPGNRVIKKQFVRPLVCRTNTP